MTTYELRWSPEEAPPPHPTTQHACLFQYALNVELAEVAIVALQRFEPLGRQPRAARHELDTQPQKERSDNHHETYHR